MKEPLPPLPGHLRPSDHTRALTYRERALESRSAGIHLSGWSPGWTRFASTPRFRAVVRQLGFGRRAHHLANCRSVAGGPVARC